MCVLDVGLWMREALLCLGCRSQPAGEKDRHYQYLNSVVSVVGYGKERTAGPSIYITQGVL